MPEFIASYEKKSHRSSIFMFYIQIYVISVKGLMGRRSSDLSPSPDSQRFSLMEQPGDVTADCLPDWMINQKGGGVCKGGAQDLSISWIDSTLPKRIVHHRRQTPGTRMHACTARSQLDEWTLRWRARRPCTLAVHVHSWRVCQDWRNTPG